MLGIRGFHKSKSSVARADVALHGREAQEK